MDQPVGINNQLPSETGNNKRPLSWVVIGIVVLLVGIASFFLGRMSVQTNSAQIVSPTPPLPTGQTNAPTTVVSPILVTEAPTPNPLTPEPTNQFTGTCPPGYYQYGVPLGCVPTTYQCDEKTGGCPICLAGSTTILTPNGRLNVKEITIGTPVWTVDASGNRMQMPVLAVSKRKVGENHHVLHIVLEDSREVWVSAGHPAANGKNVEKLAAGDSYDGSRIISVTLESYTEGYTYDILPAGETGYYFANDVLMGSTLKK